MGLGVLVGFGGGFLVLPWVLSSVFESESFGFCVQKFNGYGLLGMTFGVSHCGSTCFGSGFWYEILNLDPKP